MSIQIYATMMERRQSKTPEQPAEICGFLMTDPTSINDRPIACEAGLAIWKQLETQLADEIGKGAFGDEGRLPTEAALARRFTVNRHTVRRAIAALTDRGLVRVERGRGMFVQDVMIDYPLKRRTSFSANLLGQGRAPTNETVAVKDMVADEAMAKALGLKKGALLVGRGSIGFADDVPIATGLTCFSKQRFPDLAEQFQRTNSISDALRASGLDDYRRLSTRIFTRLPTSAEAAALRQPMAQPVLVTEAIDGDDKGRPISFGETCFAGARVQITVEPEPSLN